MECAEEKNEPFGARRIKAFQQGGQDGALRKLAKQRGRLEAAERAGGGLFGGEHHFEANVRRCVNDGAAGFAEELEAVEVFGAIATSEADNVNDIALTKFRTAAKRVVIHCTYIRLMSGSDGVMEIHPQECLPEPEVEQRGVQIAAAESFDNAPSCDLGQSAFVHCDVRSPIHLAHWF